MTKDEALRLALEALEEIGLKWPNVLKAIDAIKEALETKDEPLQSIWDTLPSNKDVADAMHMKRLHQLSTTPQRIWVGLKDDDEIPWDGVDAKSFAKAIEAKLKEKNG